MRDTEKGQRCAECGWMIEGGVRILDNGRRSEKVYQCEAKKCILARGSVTENNRCEYYWQTKEDDNGRYIQRGHGER